MEILVKHLGTLVELLSNKNKTSFFVRRGNIAIFFGLAGHVN